MKICLFSPYIPDHLGGGEKFLLDAALALSASNSVYVAVAQAHPLSNEQVASLKKKYQDFLGKSLEKVTFIATPLWTTASFLTRLLWTRQFDVLFFATDGSLFFSLAKRNILHIQIPFTMPKRSLIERLKLANWQVKSANSQFTQKIVAKSWNCKIPYVHYPQIDTQVLAVPDKHIKREKIILHVGRFFTHQHSKRQDILIDIFRKFQQSNIAFADWKLVFIGSVEDATYFQQVQDKASDLPIEFYTKIDRREVLDWYRRASIYWHATGYSVDEVAHPEKVEHFGISTVEAMAAGCVPLVYAAGGQQEILANELAYCLWKSIDECVQKTQELVSDDTMYSNLQEHAIARSQDFGQNQFYVTLQKMVCND